MPNIPINTPKKNSTIQAVLIDKNILTLNEAKKLLELIGYNDNGVRITKNYYRYRQFNPAKNKLFKLIDSIEYPGLKFVIQF